MKIELTYKNKISKIIGSYAWAIEKVDDTRIIFHTPKILDNRDMTRVYAVLRCAIDFDFDFTIKKSVPSP